MANVMYNIGKQRLLGGAASAINFAADTIKAMAVTSTYTPNADDQFIDTGGASDPVDARAAGTTDQTLATKVIGVDNTGDFAYLDADDVVYTSVTAGPAIEGIVIYKDTGTPTTCPMICYLDISVTPNGGNITIQFAAPASGGIAKMT
jgi:hypothetical protein